MNNLFDLLKGLSGEPGDKPGLTSKEIAEQTGLGAKRVAGLLRAGVEQGTLETVPWTDMNHWSGRPRQIVCWRAKVK